MLDHHDDPIECTVAWVKGPVATLILSGEVSTELHKKLSSLSMGFMMFNHRGSPVALRGAVGAEADSSNLEFVVLDGVQVPERRITNRIPLSIPVRVTTTAPEDPETIVIETTSSNLSITGVLLERRPGLGTGPRWKIELLVPGGGPICCGAVVARQTPSHIGVAFTELQHDDHVRLTSILAEHERGAKVAA